MALEGLAAGKHIELRFEGRRTDRYGRLLAQVFAAERGKRLWLQQAKLAKGLACFYSFPDHRGCARALLAAEGEARTKRLGVWGSPAYRIVEASDLDRLDRLMHSFQLIEGKLMAVGGRRRPPLPQFRRRLAKRRQHCAQGHPSFFRRRNRSQGARRQGLEVRGTLLWRNGPMIEASHPEQIERLPADSRRKM